MDSKKGRLQRKAIGALQPLTEGLCPSLQQMTMSHDAGTPRVSRRHSIQPTHVLEASLSASASEFQLKVT